MYIAPGTIVFGYACCIGVGLGIYYDVFRVLRMLIGKSSGIIFVEDCLFALTATGVTFWFVLTHCSGFLRGFVLVGEGLGFVIYHFTVGECVIRIFRWIIELIKKIITVIFRHIILPPIRTILKILHKIFDPFSRNLQKFKKFCFSHNFSLQLPRKILYNKHNKQGKTERMAAIRDESEEK
ncbi:MAG: spore cortex biosynthesis protein YabQ [Candidatus Merdivicinus sp.]|jgi:spore cortex biosynthesis protein YabQ